MNKRLPYEEQLAEQLNDVSLPDENMAWADMKRRLEKDDDDRIIPFWLNGCFLWILFGVVILSLGWWIFRPEKWFERKRAEIHKIPASQSGKEQQGNLSQKAVQQDSTVFFESRLKQQDGSIQNHTKEILVRINRKESSRTHWANKNPDKQKDSNEKENRSEQLRHNNNVPGNEDLVGKSKQDDGSNSDSLRHQNLPEDSIEAIDNQNVTVTKANTEKGEKGSLPPNIQSKEMKQDSSKSPAFSFAAGLSLYQQLPIGGQNFVPYNREGRKGTLADYIPSVFIRMYQRNKSFIQSEFRYGAPQYTKEFVYQQRADSVINGFITQSTSLKKTYYHQLPLTFNYFVSKNLSVGAGIVWNRFVSAISRQDIVRHNNITGTDSIISEGTILVSKIADSGNVFVKSWFQALFQAEYKWNRFSVGARYAIGLEPYIKFELQPGVLKQEKNSSVNIFLRYELWRSKKK